MERQFPIFQLPLLFSLCSDVLNFSDTFKYLCCCSTVHIPRLNTVTVIPRKRKQDVNENTFFRTGYLFLSQWKTILLDFILQAKSKLCFLKRHCFFSVAFSVWPLSFTRISHRSTKPGCLPSLFYVYTHQLPPFIQHEGLTPPIPPSCVHTVLY